MPLSSIKFPVIRSVSSRFATTSSLSFCNASVPFAGPELLYLDASRCFFSEDTPPLHAEDFCTDRPHLDGVKRCGLDTFPGGNGRTSRTLYGHGGSVSILPCQCPLVLMDGNLYRCHPEPSLGIFSQVPAVLHGRISLITTTPSRERFVLRA